MDAREGLRKAKLALGGYLNLPPAPGRGDRDPRLAPRSSPAIPPGEELAQPGLSSAGPTWSPTGWASTSPRPRSSSSTSNRYADAYLLYQPYTFQNLTTCPIPTARPPGPSGHGPACRSSTGTRGTSQRARLNIEQTQVQLRSVERWRSSEVREAEREYAETKGYLERLRTRRHPRRRGRPWTTPSDSTWRARRRDVTTYLDRPEAIQRPRPPVSRHGRPAPPEHVRPEHGGRLADLALSDRTRQFENVRGGPARVESPGRLASSIAKPVQQAP